MQKNNPLRKSILFILFAGLSLAVNAGDITMKIANKKSVADIIVDENDAKVVQIAANMLATDLYNVSGKKPVVKSRLDVRSKTGIIAGTIGQSSWIDGLIASKKIDVSQIKGKWESYSVFVVNNPVNNLKQALVIAGSDRRATAYGLLDISRMIGVSPWEWWADVTPEKKEEIELSIENKSYGSPSVKYRGIFLNDEDWGLQRWAALNFEPETGDIGPKTYAKVFELILRLRANTIWPAMHSCTKPFYFYPKNKQVADDYAIVVGTSHCEPMLCNINAEWDSKSMGEWRYDNNAPTIKDLFKKRTNESSSFESIYTMGMRGEHDSPMIVGEDDTESQVELLEKVITDQREILKEKTGKDIQQVPQVFIPYKEVLTYYQKGLELPGDISLVWTDDNYGYIRQLSTPEEQKRPGGAGIYYHTSYWGRPHDYLWLNSTHPVLMWEEMNKAYQYQSRNLWILNCGDIKPHEYNIELFLDMAWDMSGFDESKSIRKHMQRWATREFGKGVAAEITELCYEYYRLAFIRRPEFMAWSQVEPVTKAKETEFSHIHYGDEVTSRINKYQQLVQKVEELYDRVSPTRKDAFYELVYYPVIGASMINQKWLYQYKNKFTAKQGRQSATYYGEKSLEAFERIQKETNYFNKQLQNGKWNHIMSMSPRHLPVFSSPVRTSVPNNSEATLGLALESYEMEVNYDIINSYADVLPVFNSYTKNKYYIDVFLKGSGEVSWKAVPQKDWIRISAREGKLSNQPGKQELRLWVSIDWDKVPKGGDKKEPPLGHDYQLIPPGYKINSAIDFISGDSSISVGVSAYNPKFKELADYEGFIEDKGYVSIHAENYGRKVKGTEGEWQVIDGLGYSGKVITALPYTVKPQTDRKEITKSSPLIEYEFFTFNFGKAQVYLQAIPTHAFYAQRGVRCAVAIDDAEPVVVDFQTFGRSNEWKQNVLRNAAIESSSHIINKAGKHTLKIWMVDPGVMIDKVLIDLGGWKDSYTFPPQTGLINKNI